MVKDKKKKITKVEDATIDEMFGEISSEISNAVENVLSKMYKENGIRHGDITPEQRQSWDELADKFADLFVELAIQNK